MPLTPQEVANKQFGGSRFKRGYDEDEVDAFLDEVEAELRRLLTENSDLRDRVQTLQQQLSAAASTPRPAEVAPATAPQPPAPQPAAVQVPQVAAEPPEQAALRTLQLAQRTADQAIAEARSEAEKVVGEARGRAGALEREAQQRQQQILSDLDRRRGELQSRIEDLRAFEREYRTRLRAYLETQLRELGAPIDGGSAEPPTVVRASEAAGGFAPRPQSGSAFGGHEAPSGPPVESGYSERSALPGRTVEVEHEGAEPDHG